MAATLSAFADERNLLIEKYRHEGFVWSLKFRHPRGGEAVVQVYRKEVERKDSETVVVRGDWWVTITRREHAASAEVDRPARALSDTTAYFGS